MFLHKPVSKRLEILSDWIVDIFQVINKISIQPFATFMTFEMSKRRILEKSGFAKIDSLSSLERTRLMRNIGWQAEGDIP